MRQDEIIQSGLKNNLRQFLLLVIVNAFVGGMVGLERTIIPELAEQEFNLVSGTAILSFIVVFGITKALTNYFTGRLANRFGRKNLLIAGWLFAIPIPLILMFANDWSWIIVANVLLGINQGLAWSSTVVMKIDLVGEKDRGLAMGLNEFAGYLAVAITAFATGWIAGNYGLRPYPFYLGIFLTIVGLLLSWIWVRDTHHFVVKESADKQHVDFKSVFWQTTLKHRNLSSVTQAGLVNNLNDGMVWGLLPMILINKGFSLEQIGIIAGIYPGVWGIGQLFTGKMADHYNKKNLLFWGMFLQGIALILFVPAETFTHYATLAAILGLGTAMVYPTFLVVVAENNSPIQRAESIGVFRLWRDLGYAIGAVITGIVADQFGMNGAVITIAVLTFISSLVILGRMDRG